MAKVGASSHETGGWKNGEGQNMGVGAMVRGIIPWIEGNSTRVFGDINFPLVN